MLGTAKDYNDVDYNEKDLKAIFAEKKEKSVNEKRLQNRAFDGITDEELKSIIEDYGLTYETESQIIAVFRFFSFQFFFLRYVISFLFCFHF